MAKVNLTGMLVLRVLYQIGLIRLMMLTLWFIWINWCCIERLFSIQLLGDDEIVIKQAIFLFFKVTLGLMPWQISEGGASRVKY